jgi:hypothetical protein
MEMLARETVVAEYPQRVCNHLRIAPQCIQTLLFRKGQEVLTLIGSMHYKN